MLALSIPLLYDVVFEPPLLHLGGILLRKVLVANVDKTGLCVGYSRLPLSLLTCDVAGQPHHVPPEIANLFLLHLNLDIQFRARNFGQLRLWLEGCDLQLEVSTELFVVRQSLDLLHI